MCFINKFRQFCALAYALLQAPIADVPDVHVNNFLQTLILLESATLGCAVETAREADKLRSLKCHYPL